MRDLVEIFDSFRFGQFRGSNYSIIIDEAIKKTGEKSDITLCLKSHYVTVKRVIDMRNEIEHPKDPLQFKVQNFMIQDMNILLPIWYFRGKSYDVLKDMRKIIEEILCLTEEIFITLMLRYVNSSLLIQINEIPEEKRDIKMPVRFDIRASLPIKKDEETNGAGGKER